MMKNESFLTLKTNSKFHSEIYKSNRFIHRCFVIVIYKKLEEDSYQFNLVTRILTRGTKTFVQSYELSRFLYSLYGTYLDGSITKWGSNLVYSLTIKSLIPEAGTDPLKASAELAMEMILKANWNQGLFFNDYFREEKKNQLIEVKDLKNDRFRYAFEHFLEWMFKKEAFGISVLGTERKISRITNESLSAYYQDQFLQQKRMIFFLDRERNSIYEELIDQFSTFTLNKPEQEEKPVVLPCKPGQVRRKIESDRNQQSWIFLGYRFFKKPELSMFSAMILFNNILGGQSNSLLFRKIREEKGLCYFINSSLPAGIDSIIITAGISRKKQKSFEGNVQKIINQMTLDGVSLKELDESKNLTITSLYSILEHPSQLISMRIESVLLKRDISLPVLIDQIRLVTLSDIKKVASLLYLECVYLLEGTE